MLSYVEALIGGARTSRRCALSSFARDVPARPFLNRTGEHTSLADPPRLAIIAATLDREVGEGKADSVEWAIPDASIPSDFGLHPHDERAAQSRGFSGGGDPVSPSTSRWTDVTRSKAQVNPTSLPSSDDGAVAGGSTLLYYWGFHPDLFCNYNSPIDEPATMVAEQRDALLAMRRVPKVILESHSLHHDNVTDVRHVKVTAVRLHARVAEIYLDTEYELYGGDFSFAQIWKDVYGRHHGESDPCVLLNAHSLSGIVIRQHVATIRYSLIRAANNHHDVPANVPAPRAPAPVDADVTERPRTEPRSVSPTRAASVNSDETAQTVTQPRRIPLGNLLCTGHQRRQRKRRQYNAMTTRLSSRRWSDEEFALLRTQYGVVPIDFLSRRLERSAVSIQLMASRIGVAREKGVGWTPGEDALLQTKGCQRPAAQSRRAGKATPRTFKTSDLGNAWRSGHTHWSPSPQSSILSHAKREQLLLGRRARCGR